MVVLIVSRSSLLHRCFVFVSAKVHVACFYRYCHRCHFADEAFSLPFKIKGIVWTSFFSNPFVSDFNEFEAEKHILSVRIFAEDVNLYRSRRLCLPIPQILQQFLSPPFGCLIVLHFFNFLSFYRG